MDHVNYAGVNARGILLRKLVHYFEKNQVRIIICLLAFCIIILSCGIITTRVTAQRASSSRKLVTSVRIEKGDTLWSIADRYITEDYEDINTYIKEIKKTNRLTSDTIYEGCYIIVPYYSSNE